MGINCKIHYNQDSTIAFVEDKKGNRSDLFDSLNSLFGEDKALNLYALTESEQFKNQEQISVKDLVTYSMSTEDALNVKQIIEAKDALISFDVNTSQELKAKMQQAFLDSNGVFTLDKNKMIQAGYNEYEATNILATPKLANSIENLLPKLNNHFFEIDEYNSEIVKTKSGVNSFGKSNIENPFITEKNNLPQQEVKTIINGEIVDKTVGDSINILRKTYPIEPKPLSNELNSLFSTIINVTNNVGNSEYKDVQTIVKDIKKEVIDYGVDLKDIENRVSPIRKLKSFISNLRNYILNPNDDFAEVYDEFFELNVLETEPQTEEATLKIDTELSEYELFRDFNLIRVDKNNYKQVENTPKELLYSYFFEQQEGLKTTELELTTQESEEKMIISLGKKLIDVVVKNDFELRKDGKGSKEVGSILLETLTIAEENTLHNENKEYRDLFDKSEEGVLTEKEQERISEIYTSERTKKQVVLLGKRYQKLKQQGDNSAFIQSVDKILEEDSKSKIKTVEEVQSKISELEVEDFDVNSDVLESMYMWKNFLNVPIKTISNEKPDFIDIKEVVKNPYKKITSSGVKLINEDPLTRSNSELFEKQEVVEEKIETDVNRTTRIKALEDSTTVQKIKTDYSYIQDGILLTHNNSEVFVRTPQGVFEKIYEEGDLNFYAPVVSEIKNLSDIDFSKYFTEQRMPENIIEAKKYYTSKELEEINNKYFNCQ